METTNQNTAANIESTNRMSAEALIIKENSELQFVENPHKPGKLFFVCGKKTGYVSPALQTKLNNDDATLADMQYAEVSINGEVAVPTLMVVGNSSKNIKKSFGTELLRAE